MGAAGRDFHNFNTYFRDNEAYEVVAFTATQIPYINDRKYPAELAGKLYPTGIPIVAEEELDSLIRKFNVTKVYFSYSDVPHEYVMHKASQVQAAGATFVLLGPVRHHDQEPQAGRLGLRRAHRLRQEPDHPQGGRDPQEEGPQGGRHPPSHALRRPGQAEGPALRHLADLDKHKCTIEEREEYEPHIDNGFVVYAGVDYEAILREAEKEADVILWDGGNNDFPFYKSDLEIVVADPHRPGHELLYYPGETNFRRADVIVINKMDTANGDEASTVLANVREVQPQGHRRRCRVTRRSSRTASRSAASGSWSSRTAPRSPTAR